MGAIDNEEYSLLGTWIADSFGTKSIYLDGSYSSRSYPATQSPLTIQFIDDSHMIWGQGNTEPILYIRTERIIKMDFIQKGTYKYYIDRLDLRSLVIYRLRIFPSGEYYYNFYYFHRQF